MKVVATFKTNTNYLSAVTCVAPGVVPQFGVKPEMELGFIQWAVDDLMKLLAHKKQRNLLWVVGVERAQYR